MELIHDLIGIGFGPSNLSLAIAAAERSPNLNCCFIEQKPEFSWHGNMLLDGSDMQISFLKDLATLRNPHSRFTFISYLHQKSRLASFINLKTFFPSRIEFNDYLRWAAAQFDDRCHYGEQVEAIDADERQGRVERLIIHSHSRDGENRRRFARNLSIGIGGQPQIPEVFQASRDPRIIHSSQYLRHARHWFEQPSSGPLKVLVVGSGQSAAEIYCDLGQNYPQVQASLLMRSSALKPADDSPFVNEIFNPDFVDVIYHQPDSERQQLLDSLRDTNYSVVDLPLIERIYQQQYEQQVSGQIRHRLLPQRQILTVDAQPDGIHLRWQHRLNRQIDTERFDRIILATGYQRNGHWPLLAPLTPWLGEHRIERDYRIGSRPDFEPGIYLQGSCEATHGLSDTLLSLLPIRASDILDSLGQRVAARTSSRTGRQSADDPACALRPA